jgi:hypothetical protein
VKARSLVFDLFGDYLRYRGGEARQRSLITLMGCFEDASAGRGSIMAPCRRWVLGPP